jgi:Glyoxalase/Bleomycin resistance protein/Dioxygenase superfamily.
MENFHKSPNLYIGEVAIQVTDLDRSLLFYQNIIGLKILKRSDQSAQLTTDGKTPLLTLFRPENALPRRRMTTGLYHFALLVPSRSDLGSFLRHLLESGYPLLGASDHLVSEAIYLNDPDGNGIEVYRDRPSREWSWKENLVEMATLELDAQGVLSAAKNPWMGMPDGTIMGHIHLHVANLKEAEIFYTNGLGFEIVSYYPQAVFLSTGKYHHHLAINTWAGKGAPHPKENEAGLKWFTIHYPDEESREKAKVRLARMGAPVTGDETVDPSGNIIHLA